MEMKPGTIDEVRAFWDRAPLFTGESRYEPGTREFFDEHRRICREDNAAGAFDPRIFRVDREAEILDLGCGIGLWLIEFWERGFRNLTGADLSATSLRLAARRLTVYGASASLREENAEALSFADASFDHVNCQGVIHHTPHPDRAVREIFRILRPGGTAVIAVYYRNFVLRHWPAIRPAAALLALGGAGMSGRGREGIFRGQTVEDIVRMYDGAENPVGFVFTRPEFLELLRPFEVSEVFFHFFPARALPFAVPKAVHRFLDSRLPFMIFACVRKPA